MVALIEVLILDDGVLAGERSAVVCALHLIEDLGPHLGLHINLPKCVMFSKSVISHLPDTAKSSTFLIWRSWGH